MEQPGGMPRPPPKDREVCRTKGEVLGCGGFFSHGSVPPREGARSDVGRNPKAGPRDRGGC